MSVPREMSAALARAVDAPRSLSKGEIAAWLREAGPGAADELFAAARTVRTACGKDAVLPRGLIEVSNRCAKNCLYCGIRRDNETCVRYRLTHEDVMACVAAAVRRGYPAVAFQAGEIESEENTRFYEAILGALPAGLEVTLSLGEQTEAVYRRWQAAAGSRILRYLLRIESSRRDLYASLHPAGHSFDRRLACIRALKRLGYVTGSGVMIGLPGQHVEDLASDIVFFGRERLDMVGMGPFIPAPHTPLYDAADRRVRGDVDLALRMIALVRLQLWDVNIVAATALEALDPEHGITRGIDAGANVIMPNLTPARARRNYDLYPGKVTAQVG